MLGLRFGALRIRVLCDMPRILLALQFWQGDKERAGKLARFIADQQVAHSQEVDLLLSARWDCDPDPSVVRHCSRAFNVYTTKGSTKLTGHPAGCWALWHDTVEFVRDGTSSGRLPRYDCVLTFEADCVPLTKDWAVRLLGAWLRDGAGQMALGHEILPKVSPYPHLNGNMLVSGELRHLDELAKFTCSTKSAWDLKIYPLLKRHGCRSIPEIRSGIFKEVGDGWVRAAIEDGVVFVHGDKDGSVFRGLQARTGSDVGFRAYEVEDTVKVRADLQLLPFYGDLNQVFEVTNTVPWKGGRLAVGLWQHLYRPERRVELRVLDADWNVRSSKVVRGLWTYPGAGRTTLHSDPAISLDPAGGVWLSYTAETAYPAHSATQHLATIEPESGTALRHVDLSFVASNGDNTNSSYHVEERFWKYFWPDGTSFPCFVGVTRPFHVGDISQRKMSVTRNNALGGWPTEWGRPVATTNPVRVGDEWFGFFHSVGEHAGTYRGFTGMYGFLWDGERFVNHRVTGNPILVGSGALGFAWPREARYWEWPDVRVTGASFSDGVWQLLGSLNYHRNFKLDIRHGALVELFTQRPILSLRQQPRVPLRDGP